MTKAEFLERLRRALNGNMSAAAVEDNIQFYDSYFSGQIAQGRSEADVLNELGDPRILARTLIDAAERAGDARAHEANETQYRTSGYYTAGNGASKLRAGTVPLPAEMLPLTAGRDRPRDFETIRFRDTLPEAARAPEVEPVIPGCRTTE